MHDCEWLAGGRALMNDAAVQHHWSTLDPAMGALGPKKQLFRGTNLHFSADGLGFEVLELPDLLAHVQLQGLKPLSIQPPHVEEAKSRGPEQALLRVPKPRPAW